MPSCMLAVDTATEICGVALVADGRVLSELILNRGETHTKSIMAAIDAILCINNMNATAVDAYAVTRGPGSFTGLRIGISTVKGLAMATGKPVVGVSSLEVLAHQASGQSPLVCPVMDARRNEVYWSLYERKGLQVSSITAEQVGPASELADRIDADCFFIGNAVPLYRSKINSQLKHPAQWANDETNGIRPAVMARLAWDRLQNGKIEPPQTLTPVYLRKSDAELQR